MLPLLVVLVVGQVQQKLEQPGILLALLHLKATQVEMALLMLRLMQQVVAVGQAPLAVMQQTRMLATAVMELRLVFPDRLLLMPVAAVAVLRVIIQPELAAQVAVAAVAIHRPAQPLLVLEP